MSSQDIRERNRRMWDELNAAQDDVSKVGAWVDRTYAPSVTFHASTGDMNFEQIKQFHIAETGALAPRYALNQVVVEGDTVVSQFTGSYTHKGPFMGSPATGKSFQVDGAMICKVRGDKLAEVWFYLDTIAFRRGLGAFPAAGAPTK